MKVTNWRRKLSATLVAVGLISPSAVYSAGLNVNLVTNGGFENVDLTTVGAYNSPRVLDWTGPSLFAYSHDGSSSSCGGANCVVPNYADGAPPPGGGHWYFTPNNAGALLDVHEPGVYFQDIDVSTGATATAIAAGTATFNLSAFMASYLNDADSANVNAEFRNAGSTPIGSATLTDNDVGPNNVWNLNSLSGSVPVGTTSVRLSLYGISSDPTRGGDGYMDNVDFRINGVPEPSSIGLIGMGLAAAAGIARRRKD